MVTLVGLVRVTDDAGDVARQHQAVDPICARVFEEAASRRRLIKNRPELLTALHCLGPDDALVIMTASHLVQSMIDGLDVLSDLFDRGITVRVLEGIAAGDHTERSLILDAGREIAEDRRRILSWRIKDGLREARSRGVVGGRPRVIDDEKHAMIRSRREKGESMRTIAQSLAVSVGTVYNVVAKMGVARCT
jgi:DNA invertase Pin-like site-specific DNA recombinase